MHDYNKHANLQGIAFSLSSQTHTDRHREKKNTLSQKTKVHNHWSLKGNRTNYLLPSLNCIWEKKEKIETYRRPKMKNNWYTAAAGMNMNKTSFLHCCQATLPLSSLHNQNQSRRSFSRNPKRCFQKYPPENFINNKIQFNKLYKCLTATWSTSAKWIMIAKHSTDVSPSRLTLQ